MHMHMHMFPVLDPMSVAMTVVTTDSTTVLTLQKNELFLANVFMLKAMLLHVQ